MIIFHMNFQVIGHYKLAWLLIDYLLLLHENEGMNDSFSYEFYRIL